MIYLHNNKQQFKPYSISLHSFLQLLLVNKQLNYFTQNIFLKILFEILSCPYLAWKAHWKLLNISHIISWLKFS